MQIAGEGGLDQSIRKPPACSYVEKEGTWSSRRIRIRLIRLPEPASVIQNCSAILPSHPKLPKVALTAGHDLFFKSPIHRPRKIKKPG
jgi:hypothetical protein